MKSWITRALLLATVMITIILPAVAQESHPTADPAVAAAETKPAEHPVQHKSEADLILPDLGSVDFMGVRGDRLLLGGLVVCVLGLLFGVMMYSQLKGLP
ncbi:MAG TPA: hypothetical protein VF057_05600, partial [Thermoanaerobaculia bacterium]